MVTTAHDIPGARVDAHMLRAHLAATATETALVWRAPFAAKIRSIEWTPEADVTGQATDFSTISVINAGTNGIGTTVLGTPVAYSSSGVTATGGTAVALYAPTTYLAVAAGTYIGIKFTKTGNGLLLPAGLITITYEGN